MDEVLERLFMYEKWLIRILISFVVVVLLYFVYKIGYHYGWENAAKVISEWVEKNCNQNGGL